MFFILADISNYIKKKNLFGIRYHSELGRIRYIRMHLSFPQQICWEIWQEFKCERSLNFFWQLFKYVKKRIERKLLSAFTLIIKSFIFLGVLGNVSNVLLFVILILINKKICKQLRRIMLIC